MNDRVLGPDGSLDYILLSLALWAMVSVVGVEQRGMWAPRTFPHLPEVGSAVEGPRQL